MYAASLRVSVPVHFYVKTLELYLLFYFWSFLYLQVIFLLIIVKEL